MLLHMSTWREIDERLKASRTVIIPIGSNEQHGPMGLLGTDCCVRKSFPMRLKKRAIS